MVRHIVAHGIFDFGRQFRFICGFRNTSIIPTYKDGPSIVGELLWEYYSVCDNNTKHGRYEKREVPCPCNQMREAIVKIDGNYIKKTFERA